MWLTGWLLFAFLQLARPSDVVFANFALGFSAAKTTGRRDKYEMRLICMIFCILDELNLQLPDRPNMRNNAERLKKGSPKPKSISNRLRFRALLTLTLVSQVVGHPEISFA